MLSEFRLAFRSLGKSPGFTAAAILVLALGVGANTAIFSVVEASLLRPLPFQEPDRLVRLFESTDDSTTRAATSSLSEKTLRQWREHGHDIFSEIAAATGANVTLNAVGHEPARTLRAARITANFFPTLGVAPSLGRNFSAAEDRPGGAPVAIVSDDFWQRELGGRPDALGETVTLDGERRTIIGVMPKSFRHPYRADVWLPLALAFQPVGNRGSPYYAPARLQPGITPEQADLAVRRMCAAVSQAEPDVSNPRRAYLRPLHEGFITDLRPKLLVIAAAAFCTLLVAAANFAGLLLARAVAREHETAVRAALGASRGRLMREVLHQALVLAAAGTVLGLLFALWLTPALVALSPESADATGSAMREFDNAVRLDWPVFGFAALLVPLLGLGFGLLPAWRAGRTDLRTALNRSSRGATLDRGTQRWLGALVVAEIAAAAVLLVGSGVLAQYFHQLVNEPWGLETAHRLTFNVAAPAPLFESATRRAQTLEQTVAELNALPGVRSAAVTLPNPLKSAWQVMSLNVDRTPVPQPRGFFLGYMRPISAGYFATVGQRFVRGRDFTAADAPESLPVCIVNESFAHRFWPGEDAIGRRVKWGRMESSRPWLTVVGVVADTKSVIDPNDGEIVGTICLPLRQALAVASTLDEWTFVVDTQVEPRSLETAIRAALARVDSRLAAYQVSSLDETAAETRVTERFVLLLVSLFSGLALILAAIGIYGLLSLQVSRRTREFGIRGALGATTSRLVQLILLQGARLLGVGVLAGGAVAWMALRLARAYWPAMPVSDPRAWLAAVTVLALCVILACWLPARRAARVDPITALRAE